MTIKEVTITRRFDAPRRMVFKAWVGPKQMAQWFGPKSFDVPFCQLEVRPGGAIDIHMRGPDGTIFPCGGTFHEIVEPERLVFTTAAIGQDGSILIEALNTVTFTEEDGKTTMTLHARVVKAVGMGLEYIKGMDAGWSQSFDKLKAVLSGGKS